ncbi:MAG: Ni/Fe-hydrogenase, b-type cytochrome subunit [Desulfuromonas sp.]|nr:MAG: Ni/Fe-hydrogenase, b-type cytochrome subunit [Desulfuromonas sp.]
MAETLNSSETGGGRKFECAARRFLYIWEGPIRIIHWVNFFCIIILSFTGWYIHDPFITSTQHPYIMGNMRYVHYLTGVVFAVSFLARSYWLLNGEYYASWRMFPNPFDKKDRHTFWTFIRYYTFLSKDAPHILGHNPVAVVAYIGLYALFAFQILSGFALWSQADPGGSLYAATGWLFAIIGNQWVRWFHLLVMFLIGGFFINHLYSVVLFDFKSKSGEVSSIFSGWKPDRRD